MVSGRRNDERSVGGSGKCEGESENFMKGEMRRDGRCRFWDGEGVVENHLIFSKSWVGDKVYGGGPHVCFLV